MAEVRITLKKRSFILAGLAALLLGAALWTAPAARARTSFDGNWSVLIVTDSGTCDRAYRYALRIVDGRITYPDQAINVSGGVDAHGHVHVSVSAGGQHANGSGQLSSNYGQGHWSGASAGSRCSGYWQAERRG